MPDNPLFLALDQGGHASRAMVFDSKGELQATAHYKIPTQHPGPGRVEHDPKALLTSVTKACQSVIRQLNMRCSHIKAVGLATQRSTIVCWNRESGQALSPVISWQDRRASKRITALRPRQARIREITGLMLSPHYGASKISWCLEKLTPVHMAMRQKRLAAGPLASYILANLLVEKPFYSDPVNASRTLLWDRHRFDWSEEMLNLFHIPRQILPHCVPSRHVFGQLALGKTMVPLTVVTGDQAAALYAEGEPDTDSVYINLGTGAFLQRLQNKRMPDVTGLLSSVVWQEQGRITYALEGTVNGAGSAFSWWREISDMPERVMLTKMAGWQNIETEVPLFLNGISGLGSPYWQSDFHSRFIGRGKAVEKLVAIAESIVFLLTVNLQRMTGNYGPIKNIIISGGLAQWDGLCQRLSNLNGLPVKRPELHEATAIGLARLLGAKFNRHVPSAIFSPNYSRQLQNRYTRWLAAMETALARLNTV